MGEYVANQVIRLMNQKGILVKDANVLILGFAFKEDCPDVRNTKVIDIYSTLHEYSNRIVVYDPLIDVLKVKREYGIDVSTSGIEGFKECFDVVILAVAHRDFFKLQIRNFLNRDNGVVYDVKGILDKKIVDGRL